jgi:hypothetical protein
MTLWQLCQNAAVSTPPAMVPLILFFVALAICFWRIPQADRLHVKLCLLAGVIWASLPVFEHSMRRSGYALVVATFLVTALLHPLRRSTTPD